MLVSLLFAWMYFLLSSFIDFSKSILYSIGFSSNFYFHYSGQEYGAESELFKPFLHTWSLSVEEQFYILFPVILLITFKYIRKYLIHTLIIGFIISLGLAEWTSRNYPSTSFYFLHTRMWELLAGSILAYLEIKQGHRSKNKKLNFILPSIGLFLIIFTVIFFKLHFPHPSLYSTPAIVGVCLIIWFADSTEIVTRFLSTKIFVGVGLISYSLYLWHFPVFAFARVNFIFQENIVLILILVIILSTFSYLFIEKPFRNRNFKFNFVVILHIIFVIILIFLSSKIISKNGYTNRLPEIIQKDLNIKPWKLLRDINGKECFQNTDGCVFNPSFKRKIHIIGDSQIAVLSNVLKDKIMKKQYQFKTSILSGCIFFLDFNLVNKYGLKINDCNNIYFQQIRKELKKEKNQILIFGGRFPLYLSNNLFDNKEGGVEGYIWDRKFIAVKNSKYKKIEDSFKSEILQLSENNKIILIYPIPEVGWNINKKIFFHRKNKFKKKPSLKYITTSYEVYKNRTKSSFELLNSIRGENIYRVYPHTLFCDTIIKNRCVTHDDKDIFYFDDDHLSLKGAEMVNDLIMKEIKKIELKSN